ncbi:MAG TPA: DEAD/DEAH box helicase [Phycisphaerae bacterium]|nr:DEAD/DEAH box helicase [Phycisphaerae bacterium]
MDRPRFQLLPPLSDDAAKDAEQTILATFCPPIRTWWLSRFKQFSTPQRLAVPAIHAGQNTLVCAPTGSGKTLCAFIAILSDLLSRHLAGNLPPTIDTLYISPLRALGTDIHKNLTTPLSEFAPPDSIRVAQRTGDTSPKERTRIAKHPPHILITTPESLALCLANPTMRDHLRHVRRIIVDEIHALAPNKRGTDLALSIERLSHLVTTSGNPDPQRIGLSATIAPLERIAEYLVGSEAAGRECAIADASFHRPLELEIESVFGNTPFSTTAKINKHVYDTLETIIRAHRTTLIFTNLRAATERVTFQLRKRFAANPIPPETQSSALSPQDLQNIVAPAHIEAHHSSLDRDVRLDIERRLKAGELRCVVCSTSLELGIDIGTIDRVVLLNSPKGVARGLQRVGRSGHRLDATARGTFIPTVPADLLESLVTADAMRKRAVDSIRIPQNCLDVLAQHVIGLALQYQPEGIDTESAWQIVRRTLPFATLSRNEFNAVLEYVATSNVHDSTRVTAKLWVEELIEEGGGEEGRCQTPAFPCGAPREFVGRLHPLRRSVGGLYAQNVGTITQEAQVKVRIKGGAVIGHVEEAFAQVLKPGDRFVLGGRCVQFVGAAGMTVEVMESTGQSPTVPRWYSGTMAMEPGLTARMREFRAKIRSIAPGGEGAIARMLTRHYWVSEGVAKVAAGYLHAQFRYADIPVEGQLLVERVPDEDSTVLVFHTMIGRAANEALARVVAYRMHRRFGGNATVVVDDYAFGIWVAQTTAARRADRTLIRSLLAEEGFDADLAAAVEASELFKSQFRFTAIRAHALLQNKFGRRRFIGQMQSYAAKLYGALKEHHPDHLLLSETRRTVAEDILSAPIAVAFLRGLAGQGLRLLDLPSPSPFAFGLFATGKRDTLQLADTADFLLAMYEQVQKRLATEGSAKAEPAGLFSV